MSRGVPVRGGRYARIACRLRSSPARAAVQRSGTVLSLLEATVGVLRDLRDTPARPGRVPALSGDALSGRSLPRAPFSRACEGDMGRALGKPATSGTDSANRGFVWTAPLVFGGTPHRVHHGAMLQVGPGLWQAAGCGCGAWRPDRRFPVPSRRRNQHPRGPIGRS